MTILIYSYIWLCVLWGLASALGLLYLNRRRRRLVGSGDLLICFFFNALLMPVTLPITLIVRLLR